MVTCNITGASGFITGAKEIRTKLEICFPYESGGVTYVVKARYFVFAYKLLCGDNRKLKGGTRGITPFPRPGRDFNSRVVPVRANLHRVSAPYVY